MRGSLNPDNNMFERLAYGSLATTALPFSMGELGARQLAETPNEAYLAGWYGAAAADASDSSDRWNFAARAGENLFQATMNVAAVTGIGAAYDGAADVFSIGNDLLSSSSMSTAIGAGSGTIAGYETGGWKGAVVGGVVGGAIGRVAPDGSPEFTDSIGAMFGTTASHVAVNAAGGGAATIFANWATGNPWYNDLGYGIAIGGLVPVVSGESFFIGSGGAAEFGPAAANGFAGATGTWNVFGAALIAAKKQA